MKRTEYRKAFRSPDYTFHRMLREFTKTKVMYPSDDALRKSIYHSVQEISTKWTMPIQN